MRDCHMEHQGRYDFSRQLSHLRVIQRQLVYVIGLRPSIAHPDLLSSPPYFGQYGAIAKIVINHHQGVGVDDPRHGSASAYVTFVHKEDAWSAIQAVDGYWLDGRYIRASFGTTKYCNSFLRKQHCSNLDCLYLHELGSEEDRFTKEEIQAGLARHGSSFAFREEFRGTGEFGAPSGTGFHCSNPVLPPPGSGGFFETSTGAPSPRNERAKKFSSDVGSFPSRHGIQRQAPYPDYFYSPVGYGMGSPRTSHPAAHPQPQPLVLGAAHASPGSAWSQGQSGSQRLTASSRPFVPVASQTQHQPPGQGSQPLTRADSMPVSSTVSLGSSEGSGLWGSSPPSPPSPSLQFAKLEGKLDGKVEGREGLSLGSDGVWTPATPASSTYSQYNQSSSSSDVSLGLSQLSLDSSHGHSHSLSQGKAQGQINQTRSLSSSLPPSANCGYVGYTAPRRPHSGSYEELSYQVPGQAAPFQQQPRGSESQDECEPSQRFRHPVTSVHPTLHADRRQRPSQPHQMRQSFNQMAQSFPPLEASERYTHQRQFSGRAIAQKAAPSHLGQPPRGSRNVSHALFHAPAANADSKNLSAQAPSSLGASTSLWGGSALLWSDPGSAATSTNPAIDESVDI
ncbi:unnamed protein product [Chrysoparadoxa australica]